MTLWHVFEMVELALARAQSKHGPWRDLPKNEQMSAISEEYLELYQAYVESNSHGEHGEVAECIDLIVVLIRRIQFLTGERDA